MNEKEIKDYVIHTIKTGNKERIKKVLTRYQEWMKKEKDKREDDIVKKAKEIFNV